MKVQLHRAFGAALAVSLIAVSGCSEKSDGGLKVSTDASGSETASKTTEPTASETAESMTESSATMSADSSMSGDSSMSESAAGGAEASTQWALDYIGGTAGKASGDSVKIGWASASDVFPHADTSAQTAVDFINNELGGIDGKPLELVKCNIAAPEDGGKCGAQFANDPSIAIAAVGASKVGTADYFNAVAPTKATYTGQPLSLEDFVSTNSVSYTTGALGAGMGLALFTLEFKPKTVAAVVTDDAAGQAGLSVFKPIVEAGGATLVPVLISPTATAPEVETALTAAGAPDSDVIIVGTFEPACIAAYDALKNLGITGVDKKILATGNCTGEAMQKHLADVGDNSQFPNGWYFSDNGSNPYAPDLESGMQTYVDAMTAAGHADIKTKDATVASFITVMSLAKQLNAAKGDYSKDTLNGLIRGFTGPAMIVAGPINCTLSPTFKGVCASRVGFSQYLDGKWIATHEGDNSVDISPALSK